MARTFFSFDPIIWIDLETCGLDEKTKDLWQFAYLIESKGVIQGEPRNLFIRPVNPLYCGSCKTLFNGDEYPYNEWREKECPVCKAGRMIDNIDPGARTMFSIPYEDIVNKGINPKEAYNIFKSDMEKFTYTDKRGAVRQVQAYPAGYCVGFDMKFLEQWFKKVGNTETDRNELHKWFVMNGTLDTKEAVVQLYRRLIRKGVRVPQLENFKLASIHKFMQELTGKTIELEKTASADFHDALYDIGITRKLQEAIDEMMQS